jgi:protein-S-isoprenylcysteine O-methyltransferase Ste14
MSEVTATQILVTAYVPLWIIPRIIAVLNAKPCETRIHSPWLTLVMFVWVFVICTMTGFGTHLIWLGGLPRFRSVWFGTLFLFLSVTLLVECLRHLRDYYSLEIEIKKEHQVIDSGPYKFIRHPIYLSDIFGYIGVCFLVSSWLTWLTLPLFVLAIQLMIRREEYVLTSILGNQYVIYKSSTGLGVGRWLVRQKF